MRCLPVACLTLALVVPAKSLARTHLLTVAAHRGEIHEQPLRYAGRDARRVRQVFLDAGELKPADAVGLVDPTPSEVAESLKTLTSERIRPGDTLIFYASGHMDENSIHLGPQRLDFSDLFEAARASQAALRIFILDGCLSGGLTRKGVRRLGPARILKPRPNPARGEVVLTSTAPGEAALESQRLAGSFFTHFLVTGLRGAADADGDGKVSVEEVAGYVHGSTVYATAGAPTGSQHPSFRLDLAGSGVAVLTRPGERAGRIARLRVSVPGEGVVYLLAADSGQLEAELPLSRAGVLVVGPGSYRIRVATAGLVREGRVTLAAGQDTDLNEIELAPIPLLSLVRKGEGMAAFRTTLRLEGLTGLQELYSFGLSAGAGAIVSLEWRDVTVFGELSYAYSSTTHENEKLPLHRIGFCAGVSHPVRLGPLTLVFGLALEGLLFSGRRLPPNEQPSKNQTFFGGAIVPLVRLELPLGSRLVPVLTLRGRVVFTEDAEPVFSPGAGLGVGWVF